MSATGLRLAQRLIFIGTRTSPAPPARSTALVLSRQRHLRQPPDLRKPWLTAASGSVRRAERGNRLLTVMADGSENETPLVLEEHGAESAAASERTEESGENVNLPKEKDSSVECSDAKVDESDKDNGAAQTVSEAAETESKKEDGAETVTGQDSVVVIDDQAAAGREKDKTPPPEVEDASSSPPPHQGGAGGGIGGFLSSSVASVRRFFSQGPPRDRKFYESLSLEEKRKLYKCGRDYVTLDKVETWDETSSNMTSKKKSKSSSYLHNPVLNQKVSLWRGDITKLEIDAIVNAANSSLLGGGGVDGAIHRAAGYSLKDECATLNGCDTGDAKLTSGHRLPAKYVLHTVGPMNCSEKKLRSCYERCLELALANDIRSVAFPCIATGIYGYPNEDAAHIALQTTRKWLEENTDKFDRIIFCVFLKVDNNIYHDLLGHYFPTEAETGAEQEAETGAEQEGGSEAMETTDSGEGAQGPDTDNKEEKEGQPAAATGSEEFEVIESKDIPTLERSITEPGPPNRTETASSSNKKNEPATDEQTPPTPPPDQAETEQKDSDVAIVTDQQPPETCTDTAAAAISPDGESMEVEGNSPKKPKMETDSPH